MKNRKIIASAITDLIFPPRCPVCDNILKFGERLICASCSGKIRYMKEPFCMKCGKPLETEETEYCYDCMVKQHIFVKGKAVFEYHNMSDSIYRFKYKGRKEYAEFYGKCMYKILGTEICRWEPQAFIPVPIHTSRLNMRGYNQAEELAKVLGREMGIPVRKDIIKRSRKTTPQKDLNNEQRQNNLKKAFKIIGNDVKLDTIVIIDDIYTTGSTIDTMAMKLKEAGAKAVYFAALAIGKGI